MTARVRRPTRITKPRQAASPRVLDDWQLEVDALAKMALKITRRLEELKLSIMKAEVR